MVKGKVSLLKMRLEEKHAQKLFSIENPALHRFIADYVELLNPGRIFVCTDSEEDRAFIRKAALNAGEEVKLAIEGHTIHFDGYYDQARDKENTKFLLKEGVDLGPSINSLDLQEGREEIRGLLKNIMDGHALYVLFFCLGPTNSHFSIPCVQLTDSAYVAHSEGILYRPGYGEFKRSGQTEHFFKFVHSQGEVKNGVSAHIEKRRIYVDTRDSVVFSINTQYGGNTIGLKKLAMRLGIKKASREGWLTEHMFVIGIRGSQNRTSYFAGAFPSLCGKTSTATTRGVSIVGDDIAYLRKRGEEVRAVNVEKGMFGILQGINAQDDPIIWETLHRPGEIIFSNALMTEEGTCHWIGSGEKVPPKGINHSGSWYPGKKDPAGSEIPLSHPNSRFTLELKLLSNVDPEINNPDGVVLRGIIYGGRDSDTWAPVEESFGWVHGIVTKGGSLESETTAATLGKEGVRRWNPMSNLDFLSIPVGRYIARNIEFGKNLKSPPRIYSVNYFLKGDAGEFLNEKTDKAVWLRWMELRSHGEVDALKTPTGFIPQYQDLQKLFGETLDRDYTKEAYNKQFTIRVPEGLAKIERIEQIFKSSAETPKEVFSELKEQRERLEAVRKNRGDYILPERL